MYCRMHSVRAIFLCRIAEHMDIAAFRRAEAHCHTFLMTPQIVLSHHMPRVQLFVTINFRVAFDFNRPSRIDGRALACISYLQSLTFARQRQYIHDAHTHNGRTSKSERRRRNRNLLFGYFVSEETSRQLID